MPYVSESKSTVGTYVPIAGSGSGSSVAPMICKRHDAVQYGFRSGGEYEAAYADTLQSDRNWADTMSLVAAYDRLERAMSDPLARPENLPVHERRYTVTDVQSATPKVQIYLNPVGLAYTATPNLYSSIITPPVTPSDTDIRAVGGNLLRESRPTKPYANLSQWFGELTQFGGMFDVPKELPQQLQRYSGSKLDEFRRFREGGRALGSGYLAGQFGWLPFVGEVINSLDSIAKSDRYLDEFVRNSAKILRRTRSRTTFQDTYSTAGTLAGGGDPRTVYSTAINGVGVSARNLVQKSVGLDGLRFRWNSTVTRVDSYRSSAMFEYFVADPDGFVGKVKSNAQKARLLLGDPLISLSTFWELSPWSWAVDWSYNLGGLLSFQESVASDSLVARRCSSIFESNISIVTHWEPFYNSTGGSVSVSGNTISVLNYRWQRRLAGSPYDMGIDWSGFSPQRWFILGSLGLAKAPGVKP